MGTFPHKPHIILPHARIVYEHLLSFLPDGESSFVVYNSDKDSFYKTDNKKWSPDFNMECVWNYRLNIGHIDIVILTDLFNHHYVNGKLAVLSILEYNHPERINFLDPFFVGERDYTTITDMLKDD